MKKFSILVLLVLTAINYSKTNQDDQELQAILKNIKDQSEKAAENVKTSASFTDPYYREAIANILNNTIKDETCFLQPITKFDPQYIWNKTGDRLLTVSFMSKEIYDRYFKPAYQSDTKELKTRGSFAALGWVTPVPRLKEKTKEFLKEYKTLDALQKRLNQYLGLPAPTNRDEKVFVESWIAPQDLARPCSRDIYTKAPHLEGEVIDINPTQSLKDIALNWSKESPKGYELWLDNRIKNEYTKAEYAYPWTNLGYTYDWGAKQKWNPKLDPKDLSHRGTEEFFIKPNATILLHDAQPTLCYIGTKTPKSRTIETGSTEDRELQAILNSIERAAEETAQAVKNT
jgi:hypothetical protein